MSSSNFVKVKPCSKSGFLSARHTPEAYKKTTQKRLNSSFKSTQSPATSSSAFIKPKPSARLVKISNSRSSDSLKNNKHPAVLQSSISQKLSVFQIKTLESMKKDYLNHEVIYSNFLALMSQIDDVFESNPMLYFSFTRSREIFQIYLSRPGQVLLTLKALPKVLPRVKLSNKILTRSYNSLKSLNKSNLKGVAKQIYELCLDIICFKRTILKKNCGLRITSQTKSKLNKSEIEVSLNSSAEYIKKILNRSMCQSNSPERSESEDSVDLKIKSFDKADDRSFKAKLIQQMCSKMSFLKTCEGEKRVASEREVGYLGCLQEMEHGMSSCKEAVCLNISKSSRCLNKENYEKAEKTDFCFVNKKTRLGERRMVWLI